MTSRFALDIDPGKDTSLMGMFREIKAKANNKEARSRRQRHIMIMMRALFAVQAPSQLYMFLMYIIPYLFEEYDGWTKYYLKVIVVYLCIQGVANYLCTILYRSDIKKTQDKPYINGSTNRWENPPDRFAPLMSNGSTQNGYVPHSAAGEENNGLTWKYCDECEIPKPPRAHHCEACKACILKRDHHCFMVGTCIGFRNQRYFAVLTFYSIICGFVGGYFTYKYLQLLYFPVCYSWADFIPPIAFYRWVLGTAENLNSHIVVMIAQVYLEFIFGFMGFIYFTSQMTIISQGKTLYELAKFIPIRNLNSANDNFRSVFGDFWGLNFLFPMPILLRQRDNGVDWEGVKIDYNGNEQKSS